jgi:uncharacterized protein YihD (DUF1040 family)
MKDPNRIPIILELLGMYWERNPNKDLMDLLYNLVNYLDVNSVEDCDDETLREDLFNKVKTRWTLR